jgi:hypothetical protein
MENIPNNLKLFKNIILNSTNEIEEVLQFTRSSRIENKILDAKNKIISNSQLNPTFMVYL